MDWDWDWDGIRVVVGIEHLTVLINQLVFVSRERGVRCLNLRGFKPVMKHKINLHNPYPAELLSVTPRSTSNEHFTCTIKPNHSQLPKELYLADWFAGSGFGRGFGASLSCSVSLRALQGRGGREP